MSFLLGCEGFFRTDAEILLTKTFNISKLLISLVNYENEKLKHRASCYPLAIPFRPASLDKKNTITSKNVMAFSEKTIKILFFKNVSIQV